MHPPHPTPQARDLHRTLPFPHFTYPAHQGHNYPPDPLPSALPYPCPVLPPSFQAWDLYYHVFKRINKQLHSITTLELQYVSPALVRAQVRARGCGCWGGAGQPA